jgi:glycosyltransferase involved in cell wall biosynthesis
LKKILYIGNQLSKHGYTVSTIETLAPLLSHEGYDVITSSSQKNIFLRFLSMIKVTILNASKVDYVLIDTYSTLNFWYAFVVSQLCRFLKVKYIPILHGGKLAEKIDKLPFLTGLVFKNAYINSVPSQFLFLKLQSKSLNNCVFIPNQIEIDKYPFQLRNQVNPQLLWVRSLTSIYNPKMAIDVLENLKRSYPKAELCMIGPEKGMTIEELSNYAKLKKVNVTFTGKLSKPEWTKRSEKFDVFINTTHFDNTPVSVIEAMALGLPIVSTNVGGIPFLLKNNETALLVQDSAVDEMTQAIIKLIENSELANQLSQNGRKLAEQFDWNSVKNQWKEILK